jgi:aminodeoxyfutalosine synthase
MTVSAVDLEALAASHDILTLGVRADEARRKRHGQRTTFVRVATVEADLVAPIDAPSSAGEIKIVGNPGTRSAAVRRVSDVLVSAKGTPVSAFSLADLERMAASDKTTLRSLLEELCAAGLELIAEAPFDQLQDPRRSIEEVNIAGLSLARLTMHHPAAVDIVPLFKSIADVQREVGVIRAFAPLPRKMQPAIPTTGYDDVKRVAIARLIVENIPSIQVDWSLYGPKLAQVALTVGADDVDGVSPAEQSPDGRRRAPLEEIRRNILAAAQEPVERNGRFDVVRR